VPKEESTCTQEKKDECRESYSDLAACATRAEFIFDNATCCYPCRKTELEAKANGTEADAPQQTRCTKEAFEACTKAADVCESGNQEGDRLFLDEACCPTCTRPERACNIEAVVKCKKAQVDCADDQTPARIAGDCCSSCRLVTEKEPTCGTACDDDTEVCSRRGDNATACAAAQLKAVTLKKLRGDSEECPTYTTAEVRDVVTEIVKRYCDKSVNVENCRTLGKRVFNFAIKSASKVDSDDATQCVYDLTIAADTDKVSKPATNSTRHKRVEDGFSPADLINDAFSNDVEAAGEFEAVVAGDTSSAVAFGMGLVSMVAMIF
jgi:hypothetical protein